ncbi:hypothetical protein BH09VER1_BH09VER1_04860 [soil metagenome]
MSMRLCALFFWIALVVTTVRAGTVVFTSGESRSNLLELYTSEGCSSCPPADAWLSAMKDKAGLWKNYVPVAFHVDYWDSLGWPDPYSSPEFTQRQHDYAAAWRADTVYTPEFVLNGAEWRLGRGGLPVAADKPGILHVTMKDQERVTISFHPTMLAKDPLFVAVAPLGFGIVTDVHGGENRGRTLPHEFVALALLNAPLHKISAGNYEASLTLPEKTAAPIKGLAVWVHAEGTMVPLQATGGLIP